MWTITNDLVSRMFYFKVEGQTKETVILKRSEESRHENVRKN